MRAMTQVLREKYAHEDLLKVSPRANFFGLASKGMAQVRGNGALVLTRKGLYFEMLWPKREVAIALVSITAIRTPRSFLGKTVGRRLLEVSFRDGAGGTDSVAWWVEDLDAWVALLSEITGVTREG